MTITITGAKQTPTWETLQHAIRQALDVEDGFLTRIAREDGGSHYRTFGVYTLEFVPMPTGDAVTIRLEVTR